MWLGENLRIELQLSKKNLILGLNGKNNNSINVIILLVKEIIYRNSKREVLPYIENIKRGIVRYYDITRYIYFSLCKRETFLSFWSSLHLVFQNFKLDN